MKKTPGDITVLHMCTKNNICYTAPEIRRVTAVIAIFHFGLFFALIQPQKSKFKNKNEKKSLEISSFYTCVPKIMIK